jgi:hypothetical protein
MRFYNPNDMYRPNGQEGHKGVAVKKGIPHRCADLSPLLSVEVTGICIPIGNTLQVFINLRKDCGVTHTHHRVIRF